MQYPIAITHNNNQYTVSIPDIPSLQVVGNSVADVVSDARSVVTDHLKLLIQQDAVLPEASSVSSFLEHPEYAGCIWAVVGVDLARIIGDHIEINIQLPAHLYAKLAKTFSNQPLDKVVTDALKHYLTTQGQDIS